MAFSLFLALFLMVLQCRATTKPKYNEKPRGSFSSDSYIAYLLLVTFSNNGINNALVASAPLPNGFRSFHRSLVLRPQPMQSNGGNSLAPLPEESPLSSLIHGQALEFDEFAGEGVVDGVEPRAELVVPPVAVAAHPLGRRHLGLGPRRQHRVVLLADGALPSLHVRHVVEPGRLCASLLGCHSEVS